MISINIQLALFILGSLISILLAILAWIGNNMVTQLKSIAVSVQRMEIDLGILNHDHSNLKEEVKHIKEKMNL